MAYSCVRVLFEIGHESSIRAKRTPEGFTHDWEVFVRGADNTEISHFVEKVVFHLHETFPKPKRVVKEPPYSVKESGYAGFVIPIDVYFKNHDEPKKAQFSYDLQLQPSGPPISKVIREKYVFPNPSEDLRRRLIKGGGVGVVGNNDSQASDKPSGDDKHSVPALVGKPKLGGDSSKKHKAKEHYKPEEPRVSSSFTDLFGTPIKTSKVSPDHKKSSHSPKVSPVSKPSKPADKSSVDKQGSGSKSSKHGKDSSERSSSSSTKEERKEKTKERDKSKEKTSKRPSTSPKRSSTPPKRPPSPSPVKSTATPPKRASTPPKRPPTPPKHIPTPTKCPPSPKHSSLSTTKSSSKEDGKKSSSDDAKAKSGDSKSGDSSKSEKRKKDKKNRDEKPKKDKHKEHEKEHDNKISDKSVIKSDKSSKDSKEKDSTKKIEKEPVKEPDKSREKEKEKEKARHRDGEKEKQRHKHKKKDKSSRDRDKEREKEKDRDKSVKKSSESKNNEVKDREKNGLAVTEAGRSLSEGVVVSDVKKLVVHSPSQSPVVPAVSPDKPPKEKVTKHPLAELISKVSDNESSDSFSPASEDEHDLPSAKVKPPKSSSEIAETKSVPLPEPVASLGSGTVGSSASSSKVNNKIETVKPKPSEIPSQERENINKSSSKPSKEKSSSKKSREKDASAGDVDKEVNKVEKDAGRKRKRKSSIKEDAGEAGRNSEEGTRKVARLEPEPGLEPEPVEQEVVMVESADPEAKPEPAPQLFTEEYVSELKELQHKIMTLEDNAELQRVVQVIAETGQYEITKKTFDFDLCALDRSTVQRLQAFFTPS